MHDRCASLESRGQILPACRRPMRRCLVHRFSAPARKCGAAPVRCPRIPTLLFAAPGIREILPVRCSCGLRSSLPSRFFLSLRFLPQRLHFVERCPRWFASPLAKPLFKILEAPAELAVRLTQRRLRIEREVACDVHEYEQEVADLVFQSRAQFRGNLRTARTRHARSRLRTRTRRGILLQVLAKFRGLLAQFIE